MPLTPKLLEYENTQFLIIGHKEDALEKATVPQADDVKQDKEEPKEEMEKLEHEDELRVEHLEGTYSPFIRPSDTSDAENGGNQATILFSKTLDSAPRSTRNCKRRGKRKSPRWSFPAGCDVERMYKYSFALFFTRCAAQKTSARVVDFKLSRETRIFLLLAKKHKICEKVMYYSKNVRLHSKALTVLCSSIPRRGAVSGYEAALM